MAQSKKSAGILLYRFVKKALQLMLVHPGGPFWKNKEEGAWSIPKGEFDTEDPLMAARREFEEELGKRSPDAKYHALQPVKLKSGKIVFAFAAEADFHVNDIVSNHCEIEWPPRSGKKMQIPEVDKAEWFPVEIAKQKINQGQVLLIDELLDMLQ
jgi:predicted NUDIX family NTP pyrophosphohydrolase